MIPTRIQRRRTYGWKAPEGTVFCTRPQPLSNPFVIDGPEFLDRNGVIAAFRVWMFAALSGYATASARQEKFRLAFVALLKNPPKHLACWCRLDERCHVDEIIEHLRVCLNG